MSTENMGLVGVDKTRKVANETVPHPGSHFPGRQSNPRSVSNSQPEQKSLLGMRCESMGETGRCGVGSGPSTVIASLSADGWDVLRDSKSLNEAVMLARRVSIESLGAVAGLALASASCRTILSIS